MKRPCICIVAGFALGEALAYAITERDPALAALPCIAAFILCTLIVLESIAAKTDKRQALILLGLAFLFGIGRLSLDMHTHRSYDMLNTLCTGSTESYEAKITGITVKGERLTLRCGELIVYYTPAWDSGSEWYSPDSYSYDSSDGSDDNSSSDGNSVLDGTSAPNGTTAPDANPASDGSSSPDINIASDGNSGHSGSIADIFSIGNHIRISGDFEVMDRPRNPGEFNYYLYYLADGATHRCFADSIEITDSSVDLLSDAIFRIRRSLLRRIGLIYDDNDAGVLKAVLLGDKSELSEDISDLYRRNGISHLLAISGLHVGIIGMSIYNLLRRRLKLPYTVCGLIGGMWIMFYCLLTGAGVSTMRATIMLLIMFMAGILGRHYDMLNSAGLAALIILLIHPYQLFNCAFLLSFSCIIAIAGPAAYVMNELKLKNALLKSLVLSLTVQLFTLPVTAYFFFEVSPYGCLLNLIVIPLMTFVVWSSLSATLLTFIWPVGAMLAAYISHYILTFYTWLGTVTLRLPCSSILIGRPSLWQIFVYYLLFFSVLYSSRLRALIQALHSSMSDRGTASI